VKKGRRVRPTTGRPLPPERIVGEVCIDQRIPELLRPSVPGQQQVLDQK
jgi:hypothetical protein